MRRFNYPPERLPEWYAHVHQFLPFAPAANLVRATLFNIGPIQILDVIVVGFWGASGMRIRAVGAGPQGLAVVVWPLFTHRVY